MALGVVLALAAGCASRATSATVTMSDGGTSDAPSSDGGCGSTDTVVASCFDQSCVSDPDCVAVAVGNASFPCELECPSAAINKGAMAAYESTLRRVAAQAAPTVCHCPSYGAPCCQQGRCSEACNDNITDRDACVAAGGTCVPYASVLEGGSACVRLSFCALDPAVPPTTLGVCCPVAPGADGGARD